MHFPLLLAVLLLLPLPSGCTSGPALDDDDASVSRSVFPIDGDVAWVVQVSDLHISAYSPERAADLARHLGGALRAIRPHLLLITGDITDAKNWERTTSRQDEHEWITYKKTIDTIVGKGGIEKSRIFDIRGNHDTYGVPYRGGPLDFFSTYSVNSQLERLSTISSIFLQGDKSYHFLGIDDTMSVGIRYPANLFGHPTDKRIEAVNSELQYWSNRSDAPVTKVVFGHFPMSFTTTSEKGQRYENVFARQSISAYLCGHLHAKVSRQLWRYHETRTVTKEDRKSSFWEWELGDWKDSRLIRILAIDRGAVSFIDKTVKQAFQTSILITYPTDSRSMNMLESKRWSPRNDINVLVFSCQVICNVSARVFDSHDEFKIVEEIPLQHVSGSTDRPLFHAKWNAENYRSPSPTRYWLQVFVLDSRGVKTSSEQRPFSVEGKMAIPPSPWLKYLVFEVQWDYMYQVLLSSNLAFIIVLLFTPRLLHYVFRQSLSYRSLAMSVLSSPIQQRKAYFWLVWFFMEGGKCKPVWFSLIIYFLWLIEMPWFWGRATAENGEIARMYLSGWSIPFNNSGLMADKLSNPDVLVITLPFLYLVIAPVIVLIYGLFAERAITYSVDSRRTEYAAAGSENTSAYFTCLLPGSTRALLMKWSGKMVHMLNRFCGSWTRRFLLIACLITTTIHLKFCSKLMSAYGAAVILSPPLTWMPLLLLGVAAYSTMPYAD